MQEADATQAPPAPLVVGGTPLISLAGWSNSGKTTLLEQLVAYLSSAGLQVGVIKHHGHTSTVDVEGKDTWRFSQAGASPVVVSSPAEHAIIRKNNQDLPLAHLAKTIAPECDLILSEGFKGQITFRIEVFRQSNNKPRIFANNEIEALVTDSQTEAAAAQQAGTPVFSLDDIQHIGDFIIDARQRLLA